jgi:hypothetical protein
MIGLGWVLFKQRGRLLFVNKKKQKNFFPLGRSGFVGTGPSEQRFFAPLFSKKAASFLFQAEPIRPRNETSNIILSVDIADTIYEFDAKNAHP